MTPYLFLKRLSAKLISDSGNKLIDLWNGEESPEVPLLSQSHLCEDDYGQAPNQRRRVRRVRRQKNSVCVPDYLNVPDPTQTPKLPATLKKGSIEQQQDRPEQKTPEKPPSTEPASLPMLGGTLVGPGPDPSICKDPDRQIPVCHSGVDAEYSNTLPWIADRLPNCHALCMCLLSFSHAQLHASTKSYKTFLRIIHVRLIPTRSDRLSSARCTLVLRAYNNRKSTHTETGCSFPDLTCWFN